MAVLHRDAYPFALDQGGTLHAWPAARSIAVDVGAGQGQLRNPPRVTRGKSNRKVGAHRAPGHMHRRGGFQRIEESSQVRHHGLEVELAHLLRKSETALVVTQN